MSLKLSYDLHILRALDIFMENMKRVKLVLLQMQLLSQAVSKDSFDSIHSKFFEPSILISSHGKGIVIFGWLTASIRE